MGNGSEMMKTSPVTSAGASDPNAELFRVITSEPPCKGAGVDPQGGDRPPPGLHELIENLYKILSLKSSHKLINILLKAQNLWV